MTTKQRIDITKAEIDTLYATGVGVSNIIRDFENVSFVNRSIHAFWYDNAHKDCVNLAYRYGLPVNIVVGLVAVLSPGLQWSINLKGAEYILQDVQNGYTAPIADRPVKYCGYGQNVRKGFDIVVNRSLSYLKGPKVNSFFDNIMSCGCGYTVTCDRHALATILGKPYDEKSGDIVPTVAAYPVCVAMFIEATELINTKHNLSLTPKQVQAVVWSLRSAKKSLY